jgi:hypothetical protein
VLLQDPALHRARGHPHDDDTYGHLFPNHDDALARALDGAFRARLAAPARPRVFSDAALDTNGHARKTLWPGTLAHYEGG